MFRRFLRIVFLLCHLFFWLSTARSFHFSHHFYIFFCFQKIRRRMKNLVFFFFKNSIGNQEKSEISANQSNTRKFSIGKYFSYSKYFVNIAFCSVLFCLVFIQKRNVEIRKIISSFSVWCFRGSFEMSEILFLRTSFDLASLRLI